MARFSAMINQFNGGMVTQRMSARTNLESWPYSCKEVVNVIPTVWGGNKKRGGTKFVKQTEKSHLIPFIFNNDIAYVVEFADKQCYFYRNGEPIKDSDGGVYSINSPYSYESITGPKGECLIRYQQSADVLYLATGNHKLSKLTRTGENEFTFSEVSLQTPPFEDKVFTVNYSGGLTKNSSTDYLLSYTGTNVVTDWLNKNTIGSGFDSDVDFYIGTKTSSEQQYTKLYEETIPYNEVYYFINLIYDKLASIDLGILAEKNQAGDNLRIFAKQGREEDFKGKDIMISFTYNVVGKYGATYYTGSFSSTEVSSLNYFNDTHLNRNIRLFYSQEGVKSWVAGSEELGDIVKSDGKFYKKVSGGTKAGTEKPVHTEGTVSDGEINWKFLDYGYIDGQIVEIKSESSVRIFFEKGLDAFFDSRSIDYFQVGLIGGNSPNYPCYVFFMNERLGIAIKTEKLPKVAFSQSGDYENFDPLVEGEVVAESAILVDVAPGEVDNINWCSAASSELLIATSSNFVLLGPSTTAEPFGPENIKIDYLSSDGAGIVNPINVGSRVMYIDEKGKSLFANGYDWESNGYRNVKLSWVAEDLFEEGIIRLEYQRDPDFSVWSLTAKGNLVCFTYEPNQNVSAFSYHYTNGKIKSMCSIPSDDGTTDELWLNVERTSPDGVIKNFIEVLTPGAPLAVNIDSSVNSRVSGAGYDMYPEYIKESWFVDCGVKKTSEEVFEEVDGLNYLEGFTVHGIADGKYITPRKVEGGKITLDEPVNYAVVGLPYTAHFIPNPINSGAQAGTSQGKTQRIHSVTLRVFRSGDFSCGDGKFFHETKFDEKGLNDIPVFTGDYKFAFPGTYSNRYGKNTSAEIIVKQDKPFPFCVNGMIVDMETYDS